MRRTLVREWGGLLPISLGGGCGLHQHTNAAFQNGNARGLIGDNGIQIINNSLLMGE